MWIARAPFDVCSNLPSTTYDFAQLPVQEVVIVVMGPTGSGKSSFIKNLTGDASIKVGHGLNSTTTKVAAYNFQHEQHTFTLVDTPGFDDTHENDTQIIEGIIKWLEQGHKLSGILYFHRIIDPRITGTARANLRMFKRLCGTENLNKVLLVTTFWNKVHQPLGERREAQLRSDINFWQPMVKQGSSIVRSKQDRDEDLTILLRVAEQKEQFHTQVQKDLQDGKSVADIGRECYGASMSAATQREKQALEARLQADRDNLEALRKQKAKKQQEAIAREKAAQRQKREALERAQRIERQRLEAEQRQREEVERQRKEDEEEAMRNLREAIEQQRKLEREENDRQRKYAAHVCRMIPIKRRSCSRCLNRMDWVGDGQWCYHCCHCDWDQFYLCQGCQATCKNSQHPTMKVRYIPQTTLTSVARVLL